MFRKKTILIFYDYFYPGYKAGGPIQSLSNLITTLIDELNIYIVTNACDLNTAFPYAGVNVNSWNNITLPSSTKQIEVFYADKGYLKVKNLERIFSYAKPDCVYLNGIFSYRYFFLPLVVAKRSINVDTVVCPRGMLQEGALSVKRFKKKLYLSVLTVARLTQQLQWHATNEEEKTDIIKNFPINRGIAIASNIPKQPFKEIFFPIKEAGSVRLVYLSLITEKKNLHLLLKAILDADMPAFLDIYGPVVDKSYWKKCLEMIEGREHQLNYKGVVEPQYVQKCLESYHALVLPTKGENFGHALYESLSVGRPVITSFFTPWSNLEKLEAGINVDISDSKDLSNAIKKLVQLPQQEYNLLCEGAYSLAKSHYNSTNSITEYKKVFGF